MEKRIENQAAATGLVWTIEEQAKYIDRACKAAERGRGKSIRCSQPQSKAPLSKVKHTVRGAKALASLMIEEFTTIKRALSKDDELSDAELD
ncbi:hypothetical protein pipiens_017869 [Culex pipiens pipiens]|uniref:Uncharacterized protein n=1 Tax=Culex pipiens pipiens TaxID=38569 RepID=A0ABD1CF94_CULPP